jgi:serine/threonine protein phosphatase 1
LDLEPMLGKLFKSGGVAVPKGGASKLAPKAPPGVRIYAVGDIHGQEELMDALHRAIAEDAAKGSQLQSVIVYLGDYVDRGMGSRQVIEELIAGPLPGFRGVYLRGNHEEAVLDFLQDPTFGMQWRNFGGLETLYSYGIEDAGRLQSPDDFLAAGNLFAERLPPSHLSFFNQLKISVTLGDYFFVHAGIRPGTALDKQSEEDMLWIRDEFLHSEADFGKVVVHGHTPEAEPVLKHNRIGVDTGAYMTGVLTCVVLEGESQRFLQARS